MTTTRQRFMRYRIYIFVIAAFLVLGVSNKAFSQKGKTAVRSLTVVTEPEASVWMDEINYGTTDEKGKLLIKPVSAGKHTLRVRADNFKEVTKAVLPAQKGEIKIPLIKTDDEAELAFQEAERMLTVDRDKAVAAYRRAIKLRPKYEAAYIGLARVLLEMSDYQSAHEAIGNVRKVRPAFPEASAIEGRIFMAQGEEEKAIASYKRAIREGKGFQPEAYTGLGLYYKEKAESFGSRGDFQTEESFYEDAIDNLQKASEQLSGSPDGMVIYQLLGLIYEKMRYYEDAIALYEEFLKLFPGTPEAVAVESFIVQLKKRLKENQ